MRILAALALVIFGAPSALAGSYETYAAASVPSAGGSGSYFPATVASETVQVEKQTVQVEVPVEVRTRTVHVPMPMQPVAAVAVQPVAYVEPKLYREARPGEIRRAKRRSSRNLMLAAPQAAAVQPYVATGTYLSGRDD